jgi:hypothetical protein
MTDQASGPASPESVSRETDAPRVLAGHVSPETAYLVADYPYGFRLRCQIRYWVETSKHGQRLVSQTSNPKRGGVWNKPKASTYSDLVVLFVDPMTGHVKHDACSFPWVDEAFVTRYAVALTSERDQKAIKLARVLIRARRHVTFTIGERSGPPQTREDQREILRRAVGYELSLSAKEGGGQ